MLKVILDTDTLYEIYEGQNAIVTVDAIIDLAVAYPAHHERLTYANVTAHPAFWVN